MFSRAYWWGCVSAGWGVPALVSAPTPPALEQRRCEYRILPTEVDVAPPRLGRLPEVPERGWTQTANQIPAASNAENPGRDPADLGDSGKVVSDPTLPGVFTGRPPAAAEHVPLRRRAGTAATLSVAAGAYQFTPQLP